jgi:hypothetical protein
MNGNIIVVSVAIAALFFIGGVIAVAAEKVDDDYQPLPGGNDIMQRIMNRIRDMLGICQGGCNLLDGFTEVWVDFNLE